MNGWGGSIADAFTGLFSIVYWLIAACLILPFLGFFAGWLYFGDGKAVLLGVLADLLAKTIEALHG